MSQSKPEVSRAMVGSCAATCLLGSLALWVLFPDAENPAWRAALLRVGLVLGALWLALPTKSRSAAWSGLSWTTFLGVLLLAFAATRMRLIAVLPIAIAVGTIGFFLRPRQKHRPQTRAVP